MVIVSHIVKSNEFEFIGFKIIFNVLHMDQSISGVIYGNYVNTIK